MLAAHDDRMAIADAHHDVALSLFSEFYLGTVYFRKRESRKQSVRHVTAPFHMTTINGCF